MAPKYPSITVYLSASDSNAFAIIGEVRKALRRSGADQQEIDKFTEEASSGDYDNVIQAAMKWVDVA